MFLLLYLNLLMLKKGNGILMDDFYMIYIQRVPLCISSSMFLDLVDLCDKVYENRFTVKCDEIGKRVYVHYFVDNDIFLSHSYIKL